jgi:hypothetical protein
MLSVCPLRRVSSMLVVVNQLFILSVFMLSVVMLSVVMLSVVAPLEVLKAYILDWIVTAGTNAIKTVYGCTVNKCC